jgi:hypothetical protein
LPSRANEERPALPGVFFFNAEAAEGFATQKPQKDIL